MLGYTYSLPKHPGFPEIPHLPAASHSHPNSRTPQVSPAEGKPWSLAHFSSHSRDVIPAKLNMRKLEMCFMLFVMPADSRYIYIYINKKKKPSIHKNLSIFEASKRITSLKNTGDVDGSRSCQRGAEIQHCWALRNAVFVDAPRALQLPQLSSITSLHRHSHQPRHLSPHSNSRGSSLTC